MPPKAIPEVIDIKAATRIVTGNLGPQGTLGTDRSAIYDNDPNGFLPAVYQPQRKDDHREQTQPNLPGPRLQVFSCCEPQPATKVSPARGLISRSSGHELQHLNGHLNEHLNEHRNEHLNETLNEHTLNEHTPNETPNKTLNKTLNENETLNKIESPEAFASN